MISVYPRLYLGAIIRQSHHQLQLGSSEASSPCVLRVRPARIAQHRLTSIKDETGKLSMIATRLARSASPARTEIKSWQSCCLDCENGGAGIGLSLYFSLPWTNE